MPTELHVLTSNVEYPKATQRNQANRAIEKICSDMGANPKTITDATTPIINPSNVADLLDMFATIFKTQMGAANWYNASVPSRTMLGGGGAGAGIATGVTNYIKFASRALTATENLSYCVLPFAGTASVLKVETLNSQPAGGSLVFTIRKNGTDTALAITVAGGGGAAVNSATGSITFQAGDFMSLKVVNNNAGTSAQIGSFSVEYDQTG